MIVTTLGVPLRKKGCTQWPFGAIVHATFFNAGGSSHLWVAHQPPTKGKRMTAIYSPVQRNAPRFLTVTGLLLALCLPIFWWTMAGRPSPYRDSIKHPTRASIVWLSPLVISASQSPRAGIVMSLASATGVLLATFPLRKRLPQVVRVLIMGLLLMMILASMAYSLVLVRNPLFRHTDTVISHGKHYHLLTVTYGSGPTFDVVLACDWLGLRCEKVMQASMFEAQPIDLPTIVNQLP